MKSIIRGCYCMENSQAVEKMIALFERIESYSNGMDYTSFMQNDMAVDACVFNLSQLGELAGKIDNDYEGVNLKLVWEIIESDLPELKNELELL